MNLRLFLSLGILGAAGLQVLAAQNATAQTAHSTASSMDFAVTYNAQSTNIDTSSRFWMQGGSAQLHGQFWHGLGVVADVAETHTANMHNSGVGLDLVTATFGPRCTWLRNSQLPRWSAWKSRSLQECSKVITAILCWFHRRCASGLRTGTQS